MHLCPECHHQNPDENRFCGRCGHKLATPPPPTHYPREGYDEAELPPVSPVEPEIMKARGDVPLPHNEYAPPRSLERPQESIPVLETAAPPPETAELPRPTTNFFDLDPEPRSSGALHGPSFLGLDEAPYYLDEDEPKSHARRNWLLFALALVAVLAFAEWRNIRDTGLRYAGTMHLNLPAKKGSAAPTQPPPPAPTASNTTPNGGSPEIQVNPQNSNLPQNAAQPGNNGGAPAGTSPASPNGSQQKVASPQDQAKPDTATPEPGKPPNSAAKDSSNANSADEWQASAETGDNAAEDNPPAKEARPRKQTRVAKAKPAEPLKSAGAEDFALANQSNDPATTVKYLWAATSKGNTDAPVLLADMYANGRGVSKDCEQANVLLDSSARRGNPRAQARLGVNYATGKCVQQDRAQAWQWLSRAHQTDPASDWIEQYRQRLRSQLTPQERSRAGLSTTASE